MTRFIATLLAVCTTTAIFSQPYIQNQYQVSVEKDITYGVAKDFAGNDITLKMDIYKPLNNNDINRPIYLHFHGGSWLEISNKEQVEDAAVCMEMAKKGYVVANCEYRRGYHRLNYYIPYALCNAIAFPDKTDCFYVQDTSEIIRAIYRGMQDAKGAIRFMKERHTIDSTNVNAVCIGGESAGGFIAMYTGYLTCPDEKPAACYALPDALVTDSDLADCNPATISLARPDLGDIEGPLNQNGFDATVVGVANYYGGIMNPILPGPHPPALYLFHQTNDVVVDCNYKMPTQSFLEQVIYPLNLCQPLYTVPKAWGSCSIKTMLTNMGATAPDFDAQIVNNGPPNSFANPPGHAYDNIQLRTTQAATLFSGYITGQLQAPVGSACLSADHEIFVTGSHLTASPNPFRNDLQINISANEEGPAAIRITDSFGKEIYRNTIIVYPGDNSTQVHLSVSAGLYFVHIDLGNRHLSGKIIAVGQ